MGSGSGRSVHGDIRTRTESERSDPKGRPVHVAVMYSELLAEACAQFDAHLTRFEHEVREDQGTGAGEWEALRRCVLTGGLDRG